MEAIQAVFNSTFAQFSLWAEAAGPKLLAALVILVVGWLAAKLAKVGVTRVLGLVKFDVAAEKAGVQAFLARGNIETSSVAIVGSLVYWLLLLLTLLVAVNAMGITEAEADRLGLTTYKVGQTWPMDMKGFHDWAEGLDLIVIVEEKRKLIEVQVKEAIFDDRRGRRVYGWLKNGEELFPTRFALNPIHIAKSIGGILIEEGRATDAIKAGLQTIEDAREECDLSYPENMEVVEYHNGPEDTVIHVKYRPRPSQDDEKTQEIPV